MSSPSPTPEDPVKAGAEEAVKAPAAATAAAVVEREEEDGGKGVKKASAATTRSATPKKRPRSTPTKGAGGESSKKKSAAKSGGKKRKGGEATAPKGYRIAECPPMASVGDALALIGKPIMQVWLLGRQLNWYRGTIGGVLYEKPKKKGRKVQEEEELVTSYVIKFDDSQTETYRLEPEIYSTACEEAHWVMLEKVSTGGAKAAKTGKVPAAGAKAAKTDAKSTAAPVITV